MAVSITDSEGGQVQTWLKLLVTDGHLSPVAISLTHPAVDLGMWDNMTAGNVGQDGWGPYTFTWTLSRPGVASITLTMQTPSGSMTLNWQPPAMGTWNVSVDVVDMSGTTVSAKASVVVNPDLVPNSGCLSAAGDPQPGGNITVWWTCGAGILGTAPLSYAWAFDGKQVKTTVPEISLVPDQTQPCPISLVVTDAVGESVTYTTAVPTTPPAITGATFTVLSQTQSGSTFNLSMRFHITDNDPDGQVVSYRVASSPDSIPAQPWIPLEWTNSILLTGAGNHTVYVQVQDDSNRTSSLYQLVVSVTAPGSSSSFSPTSWPSWWWIIPVAAVVIVALLVAMVVLSAHRKAPPTATGGAKEDDPVDKKAAPEDPPDWFEGGEPGEDHGSSP
jgi:hypothetical protein